MFKNIMNMTFENLEFSLVQKEDQKILRIGWYNWRVRKDKVLIGLYLLQWLGFTAGALAATYSVYRERAWTIDILIGWLFVIAAWTIALVLSHTLLKLSWYEWIELSTQSFSHGSMGFMAPKKVPIITSDNFLRIFLGHAGIESERDSCTTLNIYYRCPPSGGEESTLFGLWLHIDLKVLMFQIIEQFVLANQIPLEMKIEDENLRRLYGVDLSLSAMESFEKK